MFATRKILSWMFHCQFILNVQERAELCECVYKVSRLPASLSLVFTSAPHLLAIVWEDYQLSGEEQVCCPFTETSDCLSIEV